MLFLVSGSVIVTAVVVVIIYAKHFGGGLSDDQHIWGAFGDYFGGVLSVFLSFFAVMFALYVLLKTNRDKKLEQIFKFTDEFKSDKMSLNLKLLWDFYNYEDYENRRKPFKDSDDKRKKLVERYRIQHKYQTKIYFARRSVSYFYLYLSIFLQNNKIDEKSILALWPVSSISTLQTIIMPCEEAITKEGSVPDKFVHFDYLINRWKKSQNKPL